MKSVMIVGADSPLGRRVAAHLTAVPGVEHDLHHAPVVGARFVSAGIEIVALGAHRLGERHHLRHPLVAVVLLAVPEIEIAEVRQGAAIWEVDFLHDPDEPSGI